ncbi:response regulator transcription factor [Amycolatopsis sp. cg5]|uniref:helix-turn-helix transcriptional regulator n=1 Tax=Amycolatopsis sp. cg5 TaxID=3238802 RepID=UPI0035263C2A
MTTETGHTAPPAWLSAEAAELYRRIVLDPGILGADTAYTRGDDPNKAIAQLVEAGLVRPAPGAGWEAVDPALAVGTLVGRAQQALAEHLLQISMLGQNFTMLHRVHANHDTAPATLFEPVADEHAARAFLADRLRGGSPDLVACSGGPGPQFTGADVGALLTPNLLTPGGRVKLVLPSGAAHSWFTEVGDIGVRHCAQVPLTAVAVGQSAGALALPTTAGRAQRFLVYQHPAAHALVTTLLDSLWSFAKPHRPAPTGTQRAIVKLLAIGKKDENLARQLGLGLRTARKHIADILKTLGARSRFEAGVLAERNGWLDDQVTRVPEQTDGR